MKKLETFVKAIIAGGFIGIGGTVYLMAESKIVGALLFSIGLFSICTMNFNLFTGKVCYVFENKLSYLIDLVIIWLGNLVGTFAVAFLESFTRIYPTLNAKAIELCKPKFADEPISLIVLGFFCNILIYVAVDGYKNNKHELGKYLAIIFGVVVFIMCGFEHCVADMYYIFVGNCITYAHAIECLILVTIGNILGGIFIPLLRKIVIKTI